MSTIALLLGGSNATCPAKPGRQALCRLRHQELLDAAHITPDGDAEGEPVISNGVALCKLHHAHPVIPEALASGISASLAQGSR